MPTTSLNPHPLRSNPALLDLLTNLHAQSLSQESSLEAKGAHFPAEYAGGEVVGVPGVDFGEQLIALDEDKCKAIYYVLRAMGARRVIEAGTSYGVSLLWFISAVLFNSQSQPSATDSSLPSLVIGTENDPRKASIALSHVATAFSSHPTPLNLLQGDLLSTLPSFLSSQPKGSFDCLLLDIWAALALPTLEIVKPYLRKGAVVIVDNTVASETGTVICWGC